MCVCSLPPTVMCFHLLSGFVRFAHTHTHTRATFCSELQRVSSKQKTGFSHIMNTGREKLCAILNRRSRCMIASCHMDTEHHGVCLHLLSRLHSKYCRKKYSKLYSSICRKTVFLQLHLHSKLLQISQSIKCLDVCTSKI